MAWTELENYGQTPRAHADGAESVVAKCGLVALHLTPSEAVQFGNDLIAAAKAAQEEPRRHVVDLRNRDGRLAGDPRALPALNPGEGGAA